eukprot:UN03803
MIDILNNSGHWNNKTMAPENAVIMVALVGCPFCECTIGTFKYMDMLPSGKNNTMSTTDINFYYLHCDSEERPTDVP